MNLFILDHNFWDSNPRKLIKGPKDSDSSLVSNENFSEILWPSGWALGQVTWAKMTPNDFAYDVTHKKFATSTKNIFLVHTRRLADAFESLNSSLVQSAEELWCW